MRAPTHIGHIPDDKSIPDTCTAHRYATHTCQELTSEWERQIPKQIMLLECGKYNENNAGVFQSPVEGAHFRRVEGMGRTKAGRQDVAVFQRGTGVGGSYEESSVVTWQEMRLWRGTGVSAKGPC